MSDVVIRWRTGRLRRLLRAYVTGPDRVLHGIDGPNEPRWPMRFTDIDGYVTSSDGYVTGFLLHEDGSIVYDPHRTVTSNPVRV